MLTIRHRWVVGLLPPAPPASPSQAVVSGITCALIFPYVTSSHLSITSLDIGDTSILLKYGENIFSGIRNTLCDSEPNQNFMGSDESTDTVILLAITSSITSDHKTPNIHPVFDVEFLNS